MHAEIYLVLYSLAMTGELSPDRLYRLRSRLARWSARLHATGLESLAAALLDAAEPLGPLGAQLLWVAQPALGLVMRPDGLADVDDLARMLEDPDGVAWLRGVLVNDDTAEASDNAEDVVE